MHRYTRLVAALFAVGMLLGCRDQSLPSERVLPPAPSAGVSDRPEEDGTAEAPPTSELEAPDGPAPSQAEE